ncbi:GPI mannosyltransferase 3 [Nematocida parisii]|nr:GPI mannosyltransferase 3 [Nematocida parisii]KAI5129896.1 GPI mannosyltransferase 3 [Nematocida parisii]KAI5142979.1 GPI mannosyltransferase 3 [Nematocida parisii]
MQNLLTTHSLLFPALLSYRIVNAALIKTHYEPDEYFQSVEVAMNTILNKTTFTWEWFFGIRSFVFVCLYILPLLVLRWVTKILSSCINAYTNITVSHELLFMKYSPYIIKLIGATVSAVSDYSTIISYKLLHNVSYIPYEVLITTVLNIGLWLYSTRSHINSVESALTIYITHRLLSISKCKDKTTKIISHLLTVLLSIITVYIRPTSIINIGCIWIYSVYKEVLSFDRAWRVKEKKVENIFNFLKYANLYITHSRIISVTNIISCIMGVLLCVLIDSLFYKELVCSVYEFYRVNIMYKVSHVFGTLPFIYAILFLFVLLGGYTGMLFITLCSRSITYLSIEVISPLLYLIAHGVIAHKEMRFLLPMLPYINIIIARELKNLWCSDKKITESFKNQNFSITQKGSILIKKLLFSKYVFIGNLIIGIVIGLDHQNISKPIDYLRNECFQRLSSKDSPIFILNTFTPYMLPLSTYLGHKRVITRSLDNNPNILGVIGHLNRKQRFKDTLYTLRIEEYNTAESKMVDNIMLFEPLDYHYIIINSKYSTELEGKLPEFVKVHESVHKRVPAKESISIYKQAFK